MIPYIEVIDKYTLKPFALVEPSECWFELSYYEVGEFEIYARASLKNLNALKKGNYIKLPNKRYAWVITSINYSYTAGGAKMISAKGFEAKWLLFKRIIQTPLQLPNTLTAAVYKLVNDNLGENAGDLRKITGFSFELINIDINLTDTQAPRGNLGEFINNLLKTCGCGSQVVYENEQLKYKILQGQDKRKTIRFSQSLDNLIASSYYSSDEKVATSALVVSTIEDIDYTKEYDNGAKGIDRSEILINSNLSTKYEDTNGVEKETTPTSTLYQSWQVEEAKEELTNHVVLEEVNGEIDLINSKYKFETDYTLGDIVLIQDEYFNFYITPQILKYTFKQDAKSYGEEAEYGGAK